MHRFDGPPVAGPVPSAFGTLSGDGPCMGVQGQASRQIPAPDRERTHLAPPGAAGDAWGTKTFWPSVSVCIGAPPIIQPVLWGGPPSCPAIIINPCRPVLFLSRRACFVRVLSVELFFRGAASTLPGAARV